MRNQLIQDLVVRDDENYGTRRGKVVHKALEQITVGLPNAYRLDEIYIDGYYIDVQCESMGWCCRIMWRSRQSCNRSVTAMCWYRERRT